MFAVLVYDPGSTDAPTVTVAMIVAFVPGRSSGIEQATKNVRLHVPRSLERPVAEKPGFRLSMTRMPVAVEGPALRTVIVYVTVVPATTDVGLADFSTTSSACAGPT